MGSINPLAYVEFSPPFSEPMQGAKLIASITELNLKNVWSYLIFIPHAIKSKLQASKAKGIVSIALSSEGIFTQRTLTVWETEQAMRDYVKSGAHIKAMKAFARHAKKSYTAHFSVESTPTWDVAMGLFAKTRKRALREEALMITI